MLIFYCLQIWGLKSISPLKWKGRRKKSRNGMFYLNDNKIMCTSVHDQNQNHKRVRDVIFFTGTWINKNRSQSQASVFEFRLQMLIQQCATYWICSDWPSAVKAGISHSLPQCLWVLLTTNISRIIPRRKRWELPSQVLWMYEVHLQAYHTYGTLHTLPIFVDRLPSGTVWETFIFSYFLVLVN